MPLPLLLAALLIAAAADDDEEELGPGPAGLVVTWRDDDRTATLPTSRLAFRLGAEESPHPQIAPERFTGHWVGRLNVVRPGKYRFTADVVGTFRLKLSGQEVLVAHDHEPRKKQTSQFVDLPFGPTELEATYEKTQPGGATVRLFWQREGEFEETVSAIALKHAPAQETKELQAQQQIEAGRRLFADRRCALCHKEDTTSAVVGLPTERGPKLDALAKSVSPAWIYRWLAAPHAVRSSASMPDLFGNTPREQTLRYAASVFLAGQSAPLDNPQPRDDAKLAAEGKQAFLTTGCIACHHVPGEKARDEFAELVSLEGVGSKLTEQALRHRLLDPRAVHPDSRMPNFRLNKQPEKLNALVAYLRQQREPTLEVELPAPPQLSKNDQRLWDWFAKQGLQPIEIWRKLGEAVVGTRGCLNCHELPGAENSAKLASNLADIVRLSQQKDPTGYFLLCRTGTRLEAPVVHALSSAKSDSLRDFLRHGVRHSTHAAPLVTAELQLDRRGCTACHDVNGRGGTFAKRILDFVQLGTDETIKDVAPPDLNGIGEKLNAAAIERVVTGDSRARPWMKLQMPHFAKEHVPGLAENLVKLDGLDPAMKPPKLPKSSPELIEQGRLLVGRTGLNCVSCHDIRGVKSIGVRGPDLALVTARVTHEWFRRWMLDPQRITPGTRMPTVFFGGQSAAPQFLGGQPEAQMTALWAYLSQGESLTLPITSAPQNVAVKGGESPRFVPEGKPLVVHGFMPGVAGLRGIAAGFPARVHFAFDSARCQLMQAWTGDFAEVGGWFDTSRGSPEDNAVKVLGKPIWHGADEATIQLVSTDGKFVPPDRVQFEACWSESIEVGFAYRLDFPGGVTLHVEEWIGPLADAKDVKFVRHMSVRGVPIKGRLGLSLSKKGSGIHHALQVDNEYVKYTSIITAGSFATFPIKEGTFNMSLAYLSRPTETDADIAASEEPLRERFYARFGKRGDGKK